MTELQGSIRVACYVTRRTYQQLYQAAEQCGQPFDIFLAQRLAHSVSQAAPRSGCAGGRGERRLSPKLDADLR